MKRLHLLIYGAVQGVFFRDYVNKIANSLNLKGFVKNNPDGTVEVVAEGDEKALRALLDKCQQGSPSSKVEKIKDSWEDASDEFDSFEVRY